MNTATANRQLAIGMIVELYMPAHNPITGPYNFCEGRMATPDEVSENILKLVSLGRTQRWQIAVRRWNRMIQEVKSPMHDGAISEAQLRYAFLQGLIYVNHQA